ncbi:hypothetical protein AVEN_37369-1 [Araneus ventricosus]|uniref:Uncharacterized protein n=1 Tax=Araneus ventricosus TaxID=182803 RepID=A0A4Y2TP62_ARAVE|nr:hypothetical protein AVEN_37369-1 [Araneus ventricosus]
MRFRAARVVTLQKRMPLPSGTQGPRPRNTAILPSALLHSPFFKAKTSLSETDDNKIPVTDPKRVKNTTIFSSKVTEESRRNGILPMRPQTMVSEQYKGVWCLVFPGNSPFARVNNF